MPLIKGLPLALQPVEIFYLDADAAVIWQVVVYLIPARELQLNG